MPTDSVRIVMRVPLRVLIGMQPRTGLGWEWDCKYEGCNGRGIRTMRDEAYDAGANHWKQAHGASRREA